MPSSQNAQQQADDSRRTGRQLARAFQNGAEPQSIDVPMNLQSGEYCAGRAPVSVFQWLEGDGMWVQQKGGWGIGPSVLGVAFAGAKIAGNAIGNSRRKAAAARDAQAQWRQVENGSMYLTNQRWCIQGNSWLDFWFEGIRMSDCTGQMIVMDVSGVPRTGLVMPDIDYWYVMFNKLAYDRVVMPDPPSDGQDLPDVAGPTGSAGSTGSDSGPRWN